MTAVAPVCSRGRHFPRHFGLQRTANNSTFGYMKSASRLHRTAVPLHRYPYRMPRFPVLSEEELASINPWDIFEFIRCEALLRSTTLQKMFRDHATAAELREKYRIPWKVLDGAHHDLPVPEDDLTRAGVRDEEVMRNRCTGPAGILIVDRVLVYGSDRYLHLQIDCAHPPKRILAALSPLLTKRHRSIKPSLERRLYHHGRYHPSKRPPFYHLSEWIDYFRCYDFRHCRGLSFGETGQRVYNREKQQLTAKQKVMIYNKAERAYHSTASIIRKAEAKEPPFDSIVAT
jgi:hypothetical protein